MVVRPGHPLLTPDPPRDPAPTMCKSMTPLRRPPAAARRGRLPSLSPESYRLRSPCAAPAMVMPGPGPPLSGVFYPVTHPALSAAPLKKVVSGALCAPALYLCSIVHVVTAACMQSQAGCHADQVGGCRAEAWGVLPAPGTGTGTGIPVY